jgi:hypothetical protein
MYAAIDEPGQVYTSGSETYAQIQPLALLEVNPEMGSDSSHYPPQPPSVDSLKQVAQVHSRQGQYILWFEISSSHSSRHEDERAFWNVVLCSLVGIDQRFRGAYCFHHQGDEE